MASSKQINSMAEGLQRLISDISMLKLAPDADLNFLTTIEMAIVQFNKNQAQQAIAGIQGAAGGGAQGMGGGPGGGGPGAGGPPMPPPQAASFGPGGASGGGMVGLNTATDPDELRRVLAGAGSPG